ncbi:MAG: nodulation protein NfeD [Thermoleophilia bacterium]|nr:nodulation protein NfeD [Thermoleophilia bacterium]
MGRAAPRALTVLLATLAAGAALAAGAHSQAPGRAVLVASLNGDVNPVTQDYLVEALRRGERDGYAAVIIEMDTPGGLVSSMRAIVREVLAVRVPVVVHVAPSGASADSAGAVIAQAADVLAMAPQTNIGSATPVAQGGEDIPKDLRRKAVEDAAAYVGEIAREHGRNVEAAEAMVRKASNYGAQEAVRLGVADLVVQTTPELLAAIDGRKAVTKGLTLDVAGARIDRVEMSAWKRALDLLIDPNVIALMLSIGLVGILVELWHPGLIFPGTVGAISLLVSLYGLQVLPVSVAGALLVALAVAFWVAEGFVASSGALAVAGAVTFVIGSLMLFDPAGDLYQVSLWTALAIATTLTLFVGVALQRVQRARRNPVEVGVSRLAGLTAVVREPGWVFVAGELWRARTADGRPLPVGATVVVAAVEEDGLMLVVTPNPEEGAV